MTQGRMNGLSRRRLLYAAGLTGISTALIAADEDAEDTEEDPEDAEEEPTEDAEGQEPEEDPDPEGTITIAAPSPPGSLDPALITDTESQRISGQIFETLVTVDPESGGLAPLLAEDWEVDDDALTYTFQLREGVRFHNGAELNAETVVANFQRWGQSDYLYGYGNISLSTPLAFPVAFGGFTSEDSCVLEEVTAVDDYTVELSLSEPVEFLLHALTSPAFGIAAESSLSDSDPGLVSRRPVGTGAYLLGERKESSTRLDAFFGYWGTRAEVDHIVVSALGRSFDRLRELTRGTVDIYDFITVENLRPLVQAGRVLLHRDPLSVLYLGFNLQHPVMEDLSIREAAARAISRRNLVDEFFLDGTTTATQFTPPSLGISIDASPYFQQNMEQAQTLLAESDYDDEPLPFYYPIGTTRSWLPQPEAVFATIARALTEAGFNIQPRPVPWDEAYVETLMADEDRAMHLLGRTAGFRSPHSFLGPLFGQATREFGYDNEDVFDLLSAARSEVDPEERADLYEQASTYIAEDLPAFPLAFPISGLALGSAVVDYPLSPVLHERFADITPAQDT